MTLNMQQWFVVHTQPSKEALAEQQLREQGFEVYLPRYKRTRRHARKVDTILSPLFPRYLFVGLDIEVDRWRSINGTRGVSYVLTFNESPASVPADTIRALKAQESEEGIVSLGALAMFVKGAKVRILEGSFTGYTAIFESMDDKQRVQLLLKFLGRETTIFVPSYAVEAG